MKTPEQIAQEAFDIIIKAKSDYDKDKDAKRLRHAVGIVSALLWTLYDEPPVYMVQPDETVVKL